MTNVMLDIETLGTAPGSAIIAIGAVAFEWIGAEKSAFYANVDHKTCESAGLKVDPETVKWWSSQRPEAIAALKPNKLPLVTAMSEFTKWFRASGGVYVWAQGANFDPPLMEAAARAVGATLPWRYYNVRDTRTLYDIANQFGFDTRNFVIDRIEHNALDDARHQVRLVCAAMQAVVRRPSGQMPDLFA